MLLLFSQDDVADLSTNVELLDEAMETMENEELDTQIGMVQVRRRPYRSFERKDLPKNENNRSVLYACFISRT